MRLLAAAALLAATCAKPGPATTPEPAPVPSPSPPPVPVPVGEPAGTQACEDLWTKFVGNECPPADTHEGWLVKCPALPATAIDCLDKTDVCQVATACLEKLP